MFHTTFDGVAVAVVVTGPAEAEAVSVPHVPGSIHSHVATPTNCGLPAGGDISIVGDPKASCFTACCARATGSTCTTAAVDCAPVTHTGGIGSITPGPAQVGITHSPGIGPPAPRVCCAWGSA